MTGDLERCSYNVISTNKVLLNVLACFDDFESLHLDMLAESYMSAMNKLGFDWLIFELRRAGF